MAVRSLRLPVNRRALAWLLCPAAKRHTRHSALPPQPALIGGRFDPPSAGPGLAQGVARLISKPEDAGQLSDGEPGCVPEVGQPGSNRVEPLCL